MIQMNPIAFTKLTATDVDSKWYSFDFTETVMMIPIAHIATVLVTLSKDRVRASNIFVIVTPPKLNTAIEQIPKITSKSRNRLLLISLK